MGTLYVVATPIGNLRDITLRAIDVLKSVDTIACEDTRVTKKLLNHYGIKEKKLISYHEHNEEKTSEKIVNILKEKDVALVSDAGTPCISDPGYRVVKKAWEKGFRVVPIPGAFAGAVALSASGLPSDKFLFVGFLSHKEKQKEKEIERYSETGYTFIVYESPHRLLNTLEKFTKILPDSHLVVAKELTKLHEMFIRGKPEDILKFFTENPDRVKGEFVLICYPEKRQEINEDSIIEEGKKLKKEGLKTKEIAKILSEKYNFSKNKIYKLIVDKI